MKWMIVIIPLYSLKCSLLFRLDFAIGIQSNWNYVSGKMPDLQWGNLLLLYTLRSAGARVSEALAFYRHIAPLERKTHLFVGL